MRSSIGSDYLISKNTYFDIDLFYNDMLNSFKGTESFNRHRYSILIDDLGLKTTLGYQF